MSYQDKITEWTTATKWPKHLAERYAARAAVDAVVAGALTPHEASKLLGAIPVRAGVNPGGSWPNWGDENYLRLRIACNATTESITFMCRRFDACYSIEAAAAGLPAPASMAWWHDQRTVFGTRPASASVL